MLENGLKPYFYVLGGFAAMCVPPSAECARIGCADEKLSLIKFFDIFSKKCKKVPKTPKSAILALFWTIEKNLFLAHISKVKFLCLNFIHRRKLIRNYVFRIFDTLSYGAVFTINFLKTWIFAYIGFFGQKSEFCLRAPRKNISDSQIYSEESTPQTTHFVLLTLWARTLSSGRIFRKHEFLPI